MIFQFRIILLVLCVLSFLGHSAFAEFPALEKKIAPALKKVSAEFDQATVLVSFAADDRDFGWDLPAAIETEMVAQLRAVGVDAHDDDHDERMFFLSRRSGFDYQAWRAVACHDYVLRAKLIDGRDGPGVSVEIYSADDPKYRKRLSIPLATGDIVLENNIPELNRKCLGYVSNLMGQTIGKGNDSAAAVLAPLNEYKCRRFGVFTLGRTLGPKEAIIPGDILYFANVEFQESNAPQTRRLSREFMIVSAVLGSGKFEALYQPVQKPQQEGIVGKVVVNLSGVVSGSLIVFRPTLGQKMKLPVTFGPLRKDVPDIDWNQVGPIDLLKYIDPELDTVRGTWALKKGGLWFGYERQNKLQIPVYLPDRYSLKFTATRKYGKHGVTIMPVIAGRQVIVTLDGFDGSTSGIGLIGKKMEDQNATTIKNKIFENHQPVEIEVQVRENQLKVLANNKIIINWKGNPARLGLHKIHQVKSKNWLHLGGYESDFLITSLTIERIE